MESHFDLLDMPKYPEEVSTYIQIGAALLKLGMSNCTVSHMSLVDDIHSDETESYLFFSEAPSNVESTYLGNNVSLSTLSKLLAEEIKDASAPFRNKTSTGKVKAWILSAQKIGKNAVIKADAVMEPTPKILH